MRFPIAALLLLPAVACKSGDDTADTEQPPPTFCELHGWTERAWVEGAGQDDSLYAVAADLTIPTTEGDIVLSEHWTGCEVYLFIQDEPRQDFNPPTPLFERDVDDLFDLLPDNVHVFFMSTEREEVDREASLARVQVQVDEELAAMDEDERAWWSEHVHFVPEQHNKLPGWLGEIMFRPGWGAGIDRFQRIRYIGSYGDWRRPPGTYSWFEPNLGMAANEAVYYNFESRRDERLEAQDATVIPIFTGEEISGGTGPGEADVLLPDAATMATFDAAELDMTMGCVGDGEYGDCPAWDYLTYLYLCEVDDPTTCDQELGRWITTYHREGRWVHDISPLLPWLAEGGTRRVRFHTSNAYEVELSLRLFDAGKEARPTRTVELFRGGAFGETYNASYQPVDVPIPASAKKVELATVISGHGQVQPDTCAEFCVVDHHFLVDGTDNTIAYEEADDNDACMEQVAEGTVPNQYGTWWYGRNGWCPGKEVLVETIDVTDQVTPGQTATIDYEAWWKGTAYTTGGANIVMRSYLTISE